MPAPDANERAGGPVRLTHRHIPRATTYERLARQHRRDENHEISQAQAQAQADAQPRQGRISQVRIQIGTSAGKFWLTFYCRYAAKTGKQKHEPKW